MARARLGLFVAVALVTSALLAACGSDDDDDTTTVTTTAAGELQGCPDFTTGTGQRVTAIEATDCAAVQPLAEEVLSRDDCVEESPGGPNACPVQGYECTTSIDDSGRKTYFVSDCSSEGQGAHFVTEVQIGDGTTGTDQGGGGSGGFTQFSSPSGNIGCVMDAQYVRCDIAERSWEPPPEPADCELDYGQAIELGGDGAAEFLCAGDTALGGEETLDYGESETVGPYRCTSAEAGMSCENTDTKHGFFLSKESYEVY